MQNISHSSKYNDRPGNFLWFERFYLDGGNGKPELSQVSWSQKIFDF